PDAAAHLQPVHPRHHDVQQDGIEHVPFERRQPLRPVGRVSQAHAVGGEVAGEQLEQALVVIDAQHPHVPSLPAHHCHQPNRGPRSTRSASRVRCSGSSASCTRATSPTNALRAPSMTVSWRANCSPSTTPSNVVRRKASATSCRLRFPSPPPSFFISSRNSSNATPIARSCAGEAFTRDSTERMKNRFPEPPPPQPSWSWSRNVAPQGSPSSGPYPYPPHPWCLPW